MSNKKRNYRKTGQDNDGVANVKKSEDTSIVFSRLSFADEEADEDVNVGTPTKTEKLPRKSKQTKPTLTTIGGQPSEPASYSTPSQSTEQPFPLKGARKKLLVTQFLDRGRGVRAEEDIAVGQAILEEVPYVAVIDDRNLSKRCSACFCADRKLSRCSVCKITYYCSSACQKRDWASFHQEECKAFVRVSRPVPTAIRILSRILRKRYGDRPSYAEVENLENRKPDFSLHQLETFAQMAMVLRDCVNEEVIPSASEIMDLWCRFTTNSFSILDNEMVDVGVGLYPTTAMINHSCQPNCVVIFEGPNILVRSIRPIKDGEEITQSYIDIAEPVDRRRVDLRQRYFFFCRCELCEEASKNIDPRSAWKCPTPDCQGAILPPESLDISDVYEAACRTCENIVHLDASYIKDRLHRADKLYELSKDLESQDPTRAIQNLLSVLSLRSSLLHHSHESLLRTHQRLKDLYTRVQDWSSAYRHSRALLDIYYAVYPRNHPLIGVQNLASAKMLLAFKDNFEETLGLLEEAAEVLGVAYGREHAMARTARRLMEEVGREVDLRRGAI